MDYFYELLGGLCTRIGFRQVRIDQVLADVILKYLGDKPLQGSAAGRRLLKHPSALLVALNGALDRFNLPLDALQPVQQFRPVALDVSHL